MDETVEAKVHPWDSDARGSGVQFTPASSDFRAILASAPSVEEVLGKPDVYRAWLAKAQEALNG